MKLFAYPFGADDFYMKPDTALAKPTDNFFIPPVCESITYAVCYVLKFNRLGRSIKEQFAHRYYSEVNYGVCIYGHPKEFSGATSERKIDTSHDGSLCDRSLWIPGLALDYSLSMPRTFLGKDQLEQIYLLQNDNTRQPDDTQLHTFPIPSVQVVAKRIAHLSGFVYLKMGDLLLLELHKPLPVAPGTRIQVRPEIDFKII
ncbi:MAG: hypothetical protein WCS46_05140 [Bacteroidales bacterium]|jgi:hypothetical protein